MKIGFIGGHGHHYLKPLAQNPEFSIAFASDGHDEAAARAAAQKLGCDRFYESAAQMFDEFAPEIVNIGAVYAYNGDLAAQALERDLAVVTDKPIAASWQQLERLRALTQGTSRRLITEFDFRAKPEFRAARAAVQSGAVGEVILASAQKSYRFGERRAAFYANRADYGGTLLWIASHGIDAIAFACGQKLARVVGVQGNLSRPDYGSFEDHCVALFELGNGGSAIVHADYLRPSGASTHGDDRLRLAGSRGLVEVREGRCRLINAEGEQDITQSVTTRPIHEEMLAAALGQDNEFYSTAASLETAAILLKAREAADSRAWQRI